MARYQYETSPRKIETQYKKKDVKRKISKNTQIQKQPKNRAVQIIKVLAIFFILLTISYRNSLINERFTDIKKLKSELALIEKENEQLKVNIESQMNLNTVEQKAKDELGMQKQTKNQTRYVNIEKTDFIEPAVEEVVIEEKETFITKIINMITNI